MLLRIFQLSDNLDDVFFARFISKMIRGAASDVFLRRITRLLVEEREIRTVTDVIMRICVARGGGPSCKGCLMRLESLAGLITCAGRLADSLATLETLVALRPNTDFVADFMRLMPGLTAIPLPVGRLLVALGELAALESFFPRSDQAATSTYSTPSTLLTT